MTKQDMLTALSNETNLSAEVKQEIEEKINSMPDGEWSEEVQMEFDDYLADLTDQYFEAAAELNNTADEFEFMADEVDLRIKTAGNQVLNSLHDTAKLSQDLSAE